MRKLDVFSVYVVKNTVLLPGFNRVYLYSLEISAKRLNWEWLQQTKNYEKKRLISPNVSQGMEIVVENSESFANLMGVVHSTNLHIFENTPTPAMSVDPHLSRCL